MARKSYPNPLREVEEGRENPISRMPHRRKILLVEGEDALGRQRPALQYLRNKPRLEENVDGTPNLTSRR